MLVIIGFTVFLHSVRSASSLAVPQGCNKSRETTTQLFTTNRQLDELILPLSNPTVQPLPGPGFCNELYRIKDAENNEYVAKIFSDMAKRRRPTATFEVDVLASNQAVGPGIKSCTETGILMDYLVDGTTLDEETIHAPNQEPLLKGIALQLKGFHSLVAEPSGPNMLWYSLDAMLHDSTCAQLQKEFQYLISQISPLPLSTCLGHGDFKPSNVMLLPSPAGEATSIPDDIRFIDFELSGLGYRGFDVAKFFRRTDRKQSNKANLDYFVQAYCSNDFNEAKMLTMEAELLLPLTWFEAAIFFDYALRHDTDNTQVWKDLYDDRMTSYEKSLSGHEERMQLFRSKIEEL